MLFFDTIKWGENMHNKNIILNNYISKLQTEIVYIYHGLCPDWNFDTHKRVRNTLYLILDGQGEITIDGTKYYPKKNDMVLLPQNSNVSLHAKNESCYNKYWFDFFLQFEDVSFFDMVDIPLVVHFDDISEPLSLLSSMEQLLTKNDVCSALDLKASFLKLISLFISQGANQPEVVLKENDFVRKMKQYIEEHLDEHLSVKQLAEVANFNEKYFISVFKKNFGYTPARYLHVQRLEKAKHYLAYTPMKITAISNEVGYSSSQNFSNDFKTYTGYTPLEYRSILLQSL
jgi:AraC-like DNA-binding protein